MKKIFKITSVSLLVIGLVYAVAGLIYLIIWLTDFTRWDFMAFAACMSSGSIFLLLYKISYYLDEKLGVNIDNDDDDEY